MRTYRVMFFPPNGAKRKVEIDDFKASYLTIDHHYYLFEDILEKSGNRMTRKYYPQQYTIVIEDP